MLVFEEVEHGIHKPRERPVQRRGLLKISTNCKNLSQLQKSQQFAKISAICKNLSHLQHPVFESVPSSTVLSPNKISAIREQHHGFLYAACVAEYIRRNVAVGVPRASRLALSPLVSKQNLDSNVQRPNLLYFSNNTIYFTLLWWPSTEGGGGRWRGIFLTMFFWPK